MATVYGDGNGNSLSLTELATFNYGLDDDRVAGLGGNDVIATGGGSDQIDGGFGEDILAAGYGDDLIIAGGGNDTVFADAGNDVYDGGTGSDTLSFQYINWGAENAREVNTEGVTIDLTLTGLQNVGAFGLDRYRGFENLTGGLGNDTFRGTNGVNTLVGNGGHDRLYGYGADRARDLFRYETLLDSGVTAATRDRIDFFERGQDKIDLSPLDANPDLAGNQAFRLVRVFTDKKGEVRLLQSGGDTIVQVDGDADTSIDMTILVTGVALGESDLIL